MKKRYYIITAVLSYLFFTLGNIPAAKVISLAEQSAGIPVKFYGVYGSLWDGGASAVIAPKQSPVNNLQWSVSPFTLLLARISADVEGEIKEQKVTGNISISATGNISASDIRARIDAPIAQQLINMPIGELGGSFNIDIASIEATDTGLPVVEGNIKWKNAQFTLLDTVNLGHVSLVITPGENSQLKAKISNKKGALSLDGNATVNANKTYSLQMSITPEDSAKENIRQSLTMVGKRQSDGSYLVKRKGHLKDLGL